MKTCIIISDSYPYDSAREQTFLDPEVSVLTELCDLHIIPSSVKGKFCAKLNGARVIEDFARQRKFFKMFYYLLLFMLQKEFRNSIVGFVYKKHKLKHVAHVAIYYAKACIFRDYLNKYLLKNKLNDVAVISFWFSHHTYGAALQKLISPKLRVITRAHGYDLYEERWASNKIPFRRHAISLIDAIFPDSEAGLKYLTSKYPEHAAKYHIGRLGVKSRNIISKPSSDGVIRLVTCAYLVPVKRIHLIACALLSLSRRYPDQPIIWTHFGDGPEKHFVKSFVSKITSPIIQCIFAGEVSNSDVFEHYANNPVDFYVNVSKSEGTPVSVIEAISCSIPPIVTSVGGNVEVVDGSNGVLLPENFKDFELADIIVKTFYDKNLYKRMKEMSYAKWKNMYDPYVNYNEFYNFIQSLSL